MKLATSLSVLLTTAGAVLGRPQQFRKSDEELVDFNDYDEDDRDLHWKKPWYINVKVTNIMEAQVLSPFFYMTHKCDVSLFTVGEMASAELAELAENGNPAPLNDTYSASMKVCDSGFNDGPTMPGKTTELDIKVGYCGCYTIASMLVGTNDAFAPVNGARIHHYSKGKMYPAFDAGSEGNSELCEHVPGPPCFTGANNTNAGNPEGFVHINRGISGAYDIGFAYDWRNPVIAVSQSAYRKMN